MSDSAAALKSGDKPRMQISEARIWLAAFAGMAAAVAGSSIWGLCEGNDLVSVAIGVSGAALGGLLAWGGYHLVSQRPEDVFTIVGVMGPVTMMRGQAPDLR